MRSVSTSSTTIPGFRAKLGITGQAGGAIGQFQSGRDGVSQGMLRVREGAGGAGQVGGRPGDVWFRLVNTFLSTNPFGGLALVVVAVAGEAVAVWAEQDAIFVEAAFQTRVWIIVVPGMERTDGTQGVEFVVNKFQDFRVSFTGIAEQFSDFQVWET